MRILLGTHQLEAREGSELFTAELAGSFRARGFEVAIFTFFKGELAALIETQGIPVFDPDDADAIARFMPDIVHTNHLPCAHFLRAVIPDAIRVHAMLGVIPHLETAPLDGRAYALGLAVSEEVLARINETPFGKEAEVVLFRNWFDDQAVVMAEPRALRRPLRIVVVSNHIAPEVIAALDAMEAAGEAKADYFGRERTSVVIDGALLTRYDVAISIGRTVLLAAACRVPCIMADIHGSDGLLTAGNLDQVRAHNFSGRLTRQPVTRAHLTQEIGKIAGQDAEALRRKVAADYALSARADWLLSRYQALLAARPVKPAREPAPSSIPGEGIVHAEMTARVRHLHSVLARERAEAARREADITRERDDALRQLGDLQRSRLLKVGRFLRRLTGRSGAR